MFVCTAFKPISRLNFYNKFVWKNFNQFNWTGRISKPNYRIFLDRKEIHKSACFLKRRKTAEERKAPRIFEYSSSKSKNKSKVLGVIDVYRNITVAELAHKLGKEIEEVQEAMLYTQASNDIEPHSRLEDLKIIRDIASKCGMKTRVVASAEKQIKEEPDRDIVPRPAALPDRLKSRPPVVTVMGHVDHGKTTLLDSLRGASVAADEAGGITQHIGAFTVPLPNGEKVTFLDTPGHAAFSTMRARGANVTDIIVLVVAADDGVMTQTKEVVKLAQAAKVPIIVAVNKIDKPEADVEKTKRELLQLGVELEDYGGDVQVIPISASKGTNLNHLAEAISTQATVMGLKAEYSGPVEGVVVESKADVRRGKLSTAIVTRGTLRKSSVLVSGLAWCKVRGLFDHNGNIIELAPPATPVEVLGWRELPSAGDIILEVESEKKAHSVMRWRQTRALKEKAEEGKDAIAKKEKEHFEKYRAERDARRLITRYKIRNKEPRAKEYTDADSTPRVKIILKGDVHGSVEAILDVLDTYTESHKCRIDVVHYGVGDVNDGDLELAILFEAIIYAFGVKIIAKQSKSVRIREFDIIYRLIDNLKEEINSKLPHIDVEEIIGEAKVLQPFSITEGRKEVPVAGCRCTKGILKKAAKFKLIRAENVLYDGNVVSIRNLKNEVESVKKDVECGVRLKDVSIAPQIGDTIVCYVTKLEPQTTDWDPGF